jgi:spore germination protein KC
MKFFKLLIILVLPFLITGCYDRKELDDLAYAIALGIDKGDEKNLDITYQIAIPLKISGADSKSRKRKLYKLYCKRTISISCQL